MMSKLLKIENYILNLKGKKIYFLSFFAGSIAVLGLPPLNFIPTSFVAFPILFFLMETAKNKKQSFFIGWWFGFGYFTLGLYWISFALLVDIASFWFLMPFAIFMIPAVLAIYTGTTILATNLFPAKNPYKILSFAAIWTGFELLRGYLFTGFPWNLIGYSWTFSLSVLQITSIVGIYGLSLFSIIIFTSPVLLFRKNFKALISVAILFITTFVYGYLRVSNYQPEIIPNVKFRIVQGNIPQDNKWDPEHRNNILYKYIDMSRSSGFENITHIVWPESAVPFFIQENSPVNEAIGQAVPKNGAIITGSTHAEISQQGFIEKIWNSVHVLGDNGKIISYYDKSHLVPFGEYVPFREILPIDKITPGMLDFSEGSGVTSINVPLIDKISPLICYEAIFPGRAIDNKNVPSLIINVTNDAWYRKTAGPYQHFQIVRVRAIEEGISVIRAANTGISGFINPIGKISSHTKLFEDAVLDSDIEKFLPETLYRTYGNTIILCLIVIIIFFIGFFHRKEK